MAELYRLGLVIETKPAPNVNTSVIIVGNGNVLGDGSSSRIVQGTPAAPAEAAAQPAESAWDQEVKPITDNPRSQLRQKLVEHFSIEELRTLCFDLGIDHETLPGREKAELARELIVHQQRVGRIPELCERCRELRPGVSWEDTTAPSKSTFVSPGSRP